MNFPGLKSTLSIGIAVIFFIVILGAAVYLNSRKLETPSYNSNKQRLIVSTTSQSVLKNQLSIIRHRVAEGETLNSIAANYKISEDSIL